jgi:hypothetical protein
MKDAACDVAVDPVLSVPCPHAEFVGGKIRIDDWLAVENIQ